jgi:hypothetical protein
MMDEANLQQDVDQIIEVLPSGVKMIINGTPSIENCKEFIKILLKANSKAKHEST